MLRALLWKYLRPYLFGITVASIFALLLGAVSAVLASLLGPSLQVLLSPDKAAVLSVDSLVGPRLGGLFTEATGVAGISATELLRGLPFWLVVLAAVKTFLTLTQTFLWERAGELASKDLRSDLVQGYLHLDPSTRRASQTLQWESALASIASNDIKITREYIVRFLGGLPRELLQIVFYIATLVLLSPRLFLIFLLGIVPAVALSQRFGKKLRRRANAALRDYSEMSEWLQQRLVGIETIKHYGTERLEVKKMRALAEGLFQRLVKAARTKALTSPTIEAVAIMAMAVVLFLAFREIAQGTLQGSVLLSFFSTLALLSQAFSKIGRYLNTSREASAAVARVDGALQYLTRHTSAAVRLHVEGGEREPAVLALENVSASYPEQTKAALRDFSYRFEQGKIYCVCGPSGAGKSTLFNVLLGLLKPAAGHLRAFAAHDEDAKKLTYMPQKVHLAPGSVLENVGYPDEAPNRERAKEALRRVGLEEAIRQLPQGVDTPVGEGGTGLSGGQTQRVQLARLFYHRAPLVLVDEGTSALDPETEQLVFRFLRELAETGVTIVMIAHRLAAALFADEILLLRDGRLVRSGPTREVAVSEDFRSLVGSENPH